MELLRLLSTNTGNKLVVTRMKHFLLILAGFEVYKYQKDGNYIPDTSIIQANVALMGLAGMCSLLYKRLPTQLEDYELLFLNSIGLFAAGTQRPVGNWLREDDERYLKIFIYNLLALYLHNNFMAPKRRFGNVENHSGKTFCKHFSYSQLLYLG